MNNYIAFDEVKYSGFKWIIFLRAGVSLNIH